MRQEAPRRSFGYETFCAARTKALLGSKRALDRNIERDPRNRYDITGETRKISIASEDDSVPPIDFSIAYGRHSLVKQIDLLFR